MKYDIVSERTAPTYRITPRRQTSMAHSPVMLAPAMNDSLPLHSTALTRSSRFTSFRLVS